MGVDAVSSSVAIDLARRYSGLWAAVGIHPTRVDAASTVDGVRELAREARVVAIGEVGLDDAAAALSAEQLRLFGAFLTLAQELDLALSLHVVGERRTHQLAQQMLAGRGPLRAVLHYFQGDQPLAEAYLRLGCHLSVGKPVTRLERADLREAIRGIPLDRLLLETDTYPLPGRTTEPRDIVDIARAVGELRGESYEAIAAATTTNFLRLFDHNRSST